MLLTFVRLGGAVLKKSCVFVVRSFCLELFALIDPDRLFRVCVLLGCWISNGTVCGWSDPKRHPNDIEGSCSSACGGIRKPAHVFYSNDSNKCEYST